MSAAFLARESVAVNPEAKRSQHVASDLVVMPLTSAFLSTGFQDDNSSSSGSSGAETESSQSSSPPETPDLSPGASQIYEAEAANLSGDLMIQDSIEGASGDAYVSMLGGVDIFDLARNFFNDLFYEEFEITRKITFTIDVPKSAWYTLDFTYSNTTGTTLHRDLRIDGEDVPGVLVFEDVFAPDDWSSTTDRVYLEAGSHEITLSSDLDEDEPASVVGGDGPLLVDKLTVSAGVTPSDQISARSLLMNNSVNMVAIHESAQEDAGDPSIFGPELSQLRHAGNWNQNQIDSAQIWIKGTTDDGTPAHYGPQFDSSLYFDENGILNVDYENYLPTDQELPVGIEKDYAMVPGEPLLVERYTFVNNEPLGSDLKTWEIMNRLHLPEALTQKAVWDERREVFIVELEQEGQDDPLYLAFGAFQEMNRSQAITPELVDKSPTELPDISGADLLNPSGILVEPETVDAFYSAEGLGGDYAGNGEGLTLAMATELELFPTRPVEYYFYYTIAEDLDGLEAQVNRALNPNDNTVLNSPTFWFDYTAQKWEDRLSQAVDPATGLRPIEDDALLTAYDRTIVTILQSQQPEFGSFVAATNPSYDFKVWPRDSAATAIGLDAAGMVDDAERYWNWMASIEEDGDGDNALFENGTFYTNYSFWEADEPIDFVQPEWDAQGLFLIGVLKHAQKLDEMGMSERANAFLNAETMRNAIIDSAEFISNNIEEDKGFGPPEFSIWESFFAYNGFTQVTYASGLKAAALLSDRIGAGDLAPDWIEGAKTIKAAIERPIDDENYPGLWNEEDGYFVWGITPEGNPIERPNAALDLMWVTGLFDIDDPKVQSQMAYVLENLSNNTYGIARYNSDNFYAQSPFSPGGAYESNVDETSWPQMTSYMGMGKEFMGDLDWAYNSLEWTVSRYAEGFMPPGEGVDPSLREPLPSTMVEPVTGAWYMMNLLNYTEQFDPRLPHLDDDSYSNADEGEAENELRDTLAFVTADDFLM